MPARGSPLNLLSVGERLHPLEWVLVYCVFPALLFASAPAALAAAFRTNAARQLALFVPICQVPLWLTGKLWYVDISWPWGLVMMAATTLRAPGSGRAPLFPWSWLVTQASALPSRSWSRAAAACLLVESYTHRVTAPLC